MMNKYLGSFETAFAQYSQQSKRPGYLLGLFSKVRHSQKLYPHINNLLEALQNTEDDNQAKEILTKYFKSSNTKYNNHSFSLYLIDELSTNFPEENWEQFLPANQTIIFYNGFLYRGTLQHPDDAFENGITEYKHSEKIEDYAHDASMHTGVSASLDKWVAKDYQTAVISSANCTYFKNGFLYEINYRGLGGVDILATLKKRNNFIKYFLAADKKEVNIIGHVPREDIKGCWDINNNFFPNRNYQENRSDIKVTSQADRLKNIFK